MISSCSFIQSSFITATAPLAIVKLNDERYSFETPSKVQGIGLPFLADLRAAPYILRLPAISSPCFLQTVTQKLRIEVSVTKYCGPLLAT